jgi:hypothetical protein
MGHASFATGYRSCFHRAWRPESSRVIQRTGVGKVDIDASAIRAIAIHAPSIAVAWSCRNIRTPGRGIGSARTADPRRRVSNYWRNDHRDHSSVACLLPTRRYRTRGGVSRYGAVVADYGRWTSIGRSDDRRTPIRSVLSLSAIALECADRSAPLKAATGRRTPNYENS